MSVHIENLHVGDWVTGMDDLRQREDGFYRHPFEFDGFPYKVKAICAPFVVCERNGTTVTMDTRIVGLTKLTPAYVRALKNEVAMDETPAPQPKKKRRRAKRDPRDCPRCGQRMVQRHLDVAGWRILCPDCGYDQGPVEKGIIS